MYTGLESVIYGVIANCITGLIPQLNSSPALIKRLSKIESTLCKNEPLSNIISKVLTDGGKKSPSVKNASLDEIKYFFSSPELFAITRKLLSTRLLEQNIQDFSELKEEFRSLAQVYIASAAGQEVANALYDSFVQACEYGLQTAVDAGLVAGHEAMSSYRHRLLMDELSNLRIQLKELLTLHSRVDASKSF